MRDFGVGKSASNCLDLGVEAVGLELSEEPLGVVFVVGRADVVGARGEAAHVFADAVGVGDGAEFLLPLHFSGGVGSGVAAEGFGWEGSTAQAFRRGSEGRQTFYACGGTSLK